MGRFSQYVSYVQVIDLCTFRSEIIYVGPKIRFCIAIPFDLTSRF